MSAFAANAFAANAFDAGPDIPAPVAVGAPAVILSVHTSNFSVFGAGGFWWSATVHVGGLDVSARISGQMTISAAEASARLASFSITPTLAAELSIYDSAAVTIDLTVFRGPITATFRRFTGTVESWSFDAGDRLVSLQCRDGYQERIAACGSSSEVAALLGGLAVESQHIVRWGDTDPSPSTYFNALLGTVPGTVFVDGNGVWRVIPWSIGAPAASFSAAEIFDGSIQVSGASKSDLPQSIDATLTVRANRLCAADVPLVWTGMDYVFVGRGLGDWPSATSVQSALDGLTGWYQKGETAMTHPDFSYSIPTEAGGQFTMFIANPNSVCIGLGATMHARWYQVVDMEYTVSIPLGGFSDRDSSVSDSIASDWDASAWESAQSFDTTGDIYAPVPAVSVPPKTGYEGLPGPYPTVNTALLYYPDLTDSGINDAARHVVAKAVRLAAAGLRKRQVTFERPLDPRWEIGAVLAISACGVDATGQVGDFVDTLDFSSGEAVSQFSLCCPAGVGVDTSSSATVAVTASTSIPALIPPALDNWVGSKIGWTGLVDEDLLLGFLCNVSGTVDQYDPTAPAYITQFRIVMPEIPAAVRDPVVENHEILATWSISGGSLTIDF
ncbi:MAG: hypothetical protein WAV95_15795 [Azonexus sp.]